MTLAEDLVSRSAEFQDFVIVHELLHLRARNHGKLFKALMSAHVPQRRQRRRARERLQKVALGAAPYFFTSMRIALSESGDSGRSCVPAGIPADCMR